MEKNGIWFLKLDKLVLYCFLEKLVVYIIFIYGIFFSKIIYYEMKDCLFLLLGIKEYLIYNKNVIMFLRMMV